MADKSEIVAKAYGKSITPEDLKNRFAYHRPTGNKADKHEAVREAIHDAATMVVGLTPYSREQSLALTALEEAMMWANAAIARNPEV
jgi:hypothetical protein